MQEYQERVVTEKSELDIKINKLTAFLVRKDLGLTSIDGTAILDRQLSCMVQYSNILNERIIQFHN